MSTGDMLHELQRRVIDLEARVLAAPSLRWATIASVTPLTFKLDGLDTPVEGTPSTTVSGLSLGDRVQVTLQAGRATITGRAKGTQNKVLWAGTPIYMHAEQVATLSERVSDQATGIVLVWQAYVNGAVKDYDIVYVFVPKWHVAGALNGKGVQCTLWPGNSGTAPHQKYVYVVNERILGNAINGISPRTSHVLTAVLGV
ncbi:hypothetical protein ACIFOC_00438 [Leucobacter aridicollis]|uniref:Uncharacterized protein n=1 Tax=Leucobacter aridicollis TaxID=283878 RepID=A0A852R9T2_9MICO|nr:hypothetical protein [Leucobacter aridicollis]NYD26076.1 hypothetical protein [Leucobacter aridicollis]